MELWSKEWLDDIVAGTDAKIIFVFRNPKDQAVSFYKHMKIMPDFYENRYPT